MICSYQFARSKERYIRLHETSPSLMRRIGFGMPTNLGASAYLRIHLFAIGPACFPAHHDLGHKPLLKLSPRKWPQIPFFFAQVCAVQTLLRHRSELLAAASQHVQHLHKTLTQMNLQIHHVVNDITGLTGLGIVDAILGRATGRGRARQLRDPRIKAGSETIRKSLEGNWRPEHLFTFARSPDLYRVCQQQIVNCDLEIEKMLPEFEPRVDPAERPLPADREQRRARRMQKWPPPSRIRSAYRNLQTLRSGCDANSRPAEKRVVTV